MRALFPAVLIALTIGGFGAAGAADLAIERPGSFTHYYPTGVRAGMRIVADSEPGVYVRSYWRAPWRNRHYFPFTGQRPKVGRHERLSEKYPAPKPAESFYREWSTVSLYPPHVVMPPPDNSQPLVVIEAAAASPPVLAPVK